MSNTSAPGDNIYTIEIKDNWSKIFPVFGMGLIYKITDKYEVGSDFNYTWKQRLAEHENIHLYFPIKEIKYNSYMVDLVIQRHVYNNTFLFTGISAQFNRDFKYVKYNDDEDDVSKYLNSDHLGYVVGVSWVHDQISLNGEVSYLYALKTAGTPVISNILNLSIHFGYTFSL